MRQKRNTTYLQTRKGKPLILAGDPAGIPTFLPIIRNIVVLGIDSGKIPGYAILECGEYVTSGIAEDPFTKCDAIIAARTISFQKHLPLLFIAENWPAPFLPDGRRMSHDSILGMGQNWGLWLQEIQKIPEQYRIVVRIDTLEWRRFYGTNTCSKQQAKRLALILAAQIANKPIDDHNEAEAILLAKVGCYLNPNFGSGKTKGGTHVRSANNAFSKAK